MLNFMCRMTFAAAAALMATALACPLSAQQVPGRDLYQFPLGALAEPAALASDAGGGFWNPATLALQAPSRLLLSVTALNSPIEQGVGEQLGTVAYRSGAFTFGGQIAQASVADLIRTDTDPQSIGDEIPYRSTILSAIATATRGRATLGLALRRRSGTVDDLSGHATSVDVGGTIERPGGLPVRLAASTFLNSVTGRGDRVTLLGAAEALLPIPAADVRAGVAVQGEREGAGSETYGYGSVRAKIVELHGGVARLNAFGETTTRLRLGLGLRYARYLVGVAREEGTAGLGSTYQFLLTTTFR